MALPKKLNSKGCRLLGIAVIKSAIREAVITDNYNFFTSDSFHFWAGLAYGGKSEYRSDEDIINDIMEGDMEQELKKGCGAKSKWS